MISFLLSLLIPLLLSPGVMAHEAWILTPEQVAQWSTRPKPEVFTQLNATSAAIYLVTAVALFGCLLLHRWTRSRLLFSRLEAFVASYREYVTLALRVVLFILLSMACLGLAPRAGTGHMQNPVLVVPDLELHQVSGNWTWLAVAEGLLALCFLLGIYVRGAAAMLVGLSLLGLVLFGKAMAAYIGLVGAAAVYLLLRGAGPYALPLPSISGTAKLCAVLAGQPMERAQWLLRVLVGANLLYLGLEYKFRQPNLMLGVIEVAHVPTLGMEPGTLVLWMAVVETLSGVLILTGVLVRPLSIGLFFAFVFFSMVVGEGVFSHIIFYGLLVPLIINGAGRWQAPLSADIPGCHMIPGRQIARVQPEHCN
ncbi:MAG: DoxX family protein [Candidatus Methylomirabilis oxyfera]|nr:DoxX family protein [Candidatus Methylomirabilis oxyfera]